MLQAQDLLDGVDLSVAVDLGHGGIAHVQQLAPEEENFTSSIFSIFIDRMGCWMQWNHSSESCMPCWSHRVGANLRGNTPNLSRPATLMPAMTRDLAESPSVRIRVHCSELRPPASLASSSFVRPAWHVRAYVTSRGHYCTPLVGSAVITPIARGICQYVRRSKMLGTGGTRGSAASELLSLDKNIKEPFCADVP